MSLLELELKIVVRSLLTSTNGGLDHLFLGHRRLLGINRIRGTSGLGRIVLLVRGLHGVFYGNLHVLLLRVSRGGGAGSDAGIRLCSSLFGGHD